MIKFAAQAGAIDEEKVVLESLGAIKRAGADLIFSYFALDLAEKNPPLNPPLPGGAALTGATKPHLRCAVFIATTTP